jgi:hypothetical protein
MIATCVIEVALMVYTLVRYKLNAVTRLTSLLLLFLAIFQLAEYMVCRNIGDRPLLWSRIGFMAITMLPPLGVHLLYVVAKVKKRPLLLPAYIAAAVFVTFFMVAGHAIEGHACMGNYVIFQLVPGSGWLYGLYYYVLLIATLVLGWQFLHRTKNKRVQRAVSGLMLGYTIFLLPTTTVHFFSPETLAGIPSIMCGFAVLLALAVCFIMLPVAAQKK